MAALCRGAMSASAAARRNAGPRREMRGAGAKCGALRGAPPRGTPPRSAAPAPAAAQHAAQHAAHDLAAERAAHAAQGRLGRSLGEAFMATASRARAAEEHVLEAV